MTMKDRVERQAELRELRRAQLSAFIRQQGYCDDCRESDARILDYVDREELHSLRPLANTPVSLGKLNEAIETALLLCQNCIAKRLADEKEATERELQDQRREQKEMEAKLYDEIREEYGMEPVKASDAG